MQIKHTMATWSQYVHMFTEITKIPQKQKRDDIRELNCIAELLEFNENIFTSSHVEISAISSIPIECILKLSRTENIIWAYKNLETNKYLNQAYTESGTTGQYNLKFQQK